MEQKENGSSAGVVGSTGQAKIQPPQPIPIYMPSQMMGQKPAKASAFSSIIKYFFILAFIFSIILNIYFSLIIAGGLQEKVYRAGDRKNKIALIDLGGTIKMETAIELRRMLKRSEDDKSVKAVILVVNSPGGYVPPSEMMSKYISDFKKKTNKKVYVSIQQVSASGAYWATAAVDKMYAQTNSVIGSIGVIYINIVFEKILKDKLGIEPIVIKSTRSPNKDKGSFFRMPTDQERREIAKDIDRVHQRFVEVVSKGRGIPVDDLWPLANGDVYDGPEAIENKLIDKIGFLDDAIDDLAEDLNIENPMVVKFVTPPTLKEMIGARSKAMENPLDIQKQMDKWVLAPKIQALWTGR